MLKLRQRLIPYLYSAFEECHRTGAPILRPLLFEYPADETTYTADSQFLVGDALLVAPVASRGTEYRHVYLPEGTWFHWWTGERFHGPAHILAHAPLGSPALYVRANRAIPLWPEMGFTGERAPDPLTLVVFPAQGAGDCVLYEDAGDGYAHEQGAFARTRVSSEVAGDRILIRLGEREGTYQPPRTSIRLEVHGLKTSPRAVRVDGASVPWDYQAFRLSIELRSSAMEQVVQIELS
jgi:alpha-glucosidase